MLHSGEDGLLKVPRVLQSVPEVIERVRELWLQNHGRLVSLDGPLHVSLVVVHTRQVPIGDREVGPDASSFLLRCHRLVHEPRLLQSVAHIARVLEYPLRGWFLLQEAG